MSNPKFPKTAQPKTTLLVSFVWKYKCSFLHFIKNGLPLLKSSQLIRKGLGITVQVTLCLNSSDSAALLTSCLASLNSAALLKISTYLLVRLKQNQSNRGSAIQRNLYLLSKWVFSASTHGMDHIGPTRDHQSKENGSIHSLNFFLPFLVQFHHKQFLAWKINHIELKLFQLLHRVWLASIKL